MKELFTEIEIEAPPECIWRILVDFSQFPKWNPLITCIEGEIKEGSRLNVQVKQPGNIYLSFKPLILYVDLNRELRWSGHLFVPGLFNGEHSFKIQVTGNGKVRFVQHEKFNGFLVPFFWWFWKNATRQGFENMNQALKQRAEALANEAMCT